MGMSPDSSGRSVQLREFKTEPCVPLTPGEIKALREIIPSLSISPSMDKQGHYDLKPASVIGAIEIGRLQIQISPKISVQHLFFLLSYSLDPKWWRTTTFAFPPDASLYEAVVVAFLNVLEGALRGGLLHGYRNVQDVLPTIRGRIRIDEQLRRRFGLAPPVEVRYDEFTEDIEENRLLRAALRRVSDVPFRLADTRQRVRRAEFLLQNVQVGEYHPKQLPDILYTRLNERYRLPIELARLILQATSIDTGSGAVRSAAFLIDMNWVFEKFVVVALREALGLSAQTLAQGGQGHKFWLDEDFRVPLKPDISWWESGTCCFVGDAKYKRATPDYMPNADLYQLLAYCVATGLPSGMLIYAAGECKDVVHLVRHAGKELHVVSLKLNQEPDAILNDVRGLAARVKGLRSTLEGNHHTQHPDPGASASITESSAAIISTR